MKSFITSVPGFAVYKQQRHRSGCTVVIEPDHTFVVVCLE